MMELFRPSASWIPPISEFGMVLYCMRWRVKSGPGYCAKIIIQFVPRNKFEFLLLSLTPALCWAWWGVGVGVIWTQAQLEA